MSSLLEINEASTEVHAVLASGSLSSPPQVSLSFPGLDDPVSLWNDLQSLGWVIPPRPPRPSSAIRWLGDGPNDYEIRPYRVNGFRIQPGPWPDVARTRIGALTVSVLQKHAVQIHADAPYMELIFPAQLEAERSGLIDLRMPADPLPNTVVIERAADSMAALCSYKTFGAKGGGYAEPLFWAERARQVAQTELRAQRTVVQNAIHAWRVGSGDAPDHPTIEQRSLRIIVPDVRAGAELVAMLRAHMGERVGSLPLSPMADSPRTRYAGLMIIGVVDVEKITQVREVLVQRHPTIFVRL